MRIMLTVVSEHGRRDVVIEGDQDTTVAGLATALRDAPEERGNVVRLSRARAPYGLDARQGAREPEAPSLWVDGRRLDPEAPMAAAVRDGDLVTLDPRTAGSTLLAEPGGVIEVRVAGGPGAGAVHRLGFGVHAIGSDPACAIALDGDLPPEVVELRVTPDAVLVRAVAPAGAPPAKKPRRVRRTRRKTGRRARRAAAARVHGTPDSEAVGAMKRGATRTAPLLAGEPLATARPWPEGAPLACGNSILVLHGTEPPDAHLDALPGGGLAYNRPPRLRPGDRRRRLDVPAEPVRREGIRLQLLAACLPAVLGLAMWWAFQLWFYLLIALMTPMIMIGQWISDRRHGRKQHRQAMKAYRERQAAFEENVRKARAVNERERRAASPDPAELLLTATGPRRRLWERRSHDPDALRLRLGLADLPAEIDFTPERGAPADLTMPGAPVSGAVPVSLAMRRLGVAGMTGPRDVTLGIARSLVGAAATLHSPRDLAVVVLSAHGDGAAHWDWARWLPHCAPRDADCVALVGADPEAAAQRVAELAALVAERLGDDDGPAFGASAGGAVKGWGRGFGPDEEPLFASYDDRPYDVLVILDGAQVLRGLPGMPQVLRQGPGAGVYTVAIDEDTRLLPEECATVADCGADGFVRLRGGGLDAVGDILADQVTPAWSERLARSLAPLRDVSRDDVTSVLPGSVRLLDLLELSPSGRAVAGRWRSGGRTTEVPIGVGPDGPFSVDLSRDGPHALVAGTTGAGKSELLQTLICSLAVANRPDEMTFVLIDYKGGAAFKECVRLPHTVGMVTDLDEHLTQRALASLAAEIRRRERLLLAAGAKDIEDYLELRDDPRAARAALTRASAASAPASEPAGRAPGAGLSAGGRTAGQATAGGRASGMDAGTPGRRATGLTGLTGLSGRAARLAAGHAGAPAAEPAARDTEAGPEATLEPLPRLLLVIDEFAAMVSELPDFMDGLVDIARRGRSLGIHLILATQRPGGVVTADIQANTSLRVALRVTDVAESTDVISGPEAAHISKTTPGRCYVRSGTGPAQPVQTARVGGRVPEAARGGAGPRVVEVRWRDLGHPLRPSRGAANAAAALTSAGNGPGLGGPLRAAGARGAERPGVNGGPSSDLARLVDAVVEAARMAGVRERPSPWLPPLPGLVLMDAPREGAGGHEVPPLPFGVTDLPWAQDRRPLTLDLARGGHLLIAGTARTGRSTALRTIAGSITAHASPDDVHLHAIDCGSGALLPLVALPHCGAVVTRDQLDRVERLLTRLRAEVGRRQQLLAEAGYASLAEARAAIHRSGTGDTTLRMPWLVLLLDRWEGFAAAFEGYDYGRLLDALMQLLREGPAVGLRAVVTADRSGLLGQISTLFEDRLIMRLADSADYGLAGLPLRGLPASMPAGRVVSLGEQGVVESQIALLDEDPSGPAQVAALQALGRAASGRFAGRAAPLRVDALPMRVTAAQAVELVPGFRPPSPLWALLGAGGDSLAPLGVDLLTQGPAAVVAGPARSGRSSTLVTAARWLLGQDTPVVVVTPRRSPLRDLAGLPGVLAVLGADGDADLAGALAGRDRYVVIVDDAELVSPDSPLGTALESTLRSGRDGEHGLLIAGTTGDLATAYRGFVAEARKGRTGLLLSVQSPADGDLFNVRLPRGAVGGPPGRGLLVISGTATPVQAALTP
ncbi:FtsK/SpoIIIE domain-containing protein [Sphaerisporangium sp. TRM90804]|uniref:FtsK/SpoIIIE domain-containing protein n=1 Tax=Sphaerisporangium sp. TRM90804 TaxID=3031113 RepID=UPI00244C97E8|nr:FtsK/SpoIIIE domain-containing protein [Sphaerisporangium sp. TRM90804]MDH2423945.1 FtsK/SpoIIIE domain-containing protein [Sphaerisporangium sp. TRM90804]